MWASTCSTLIVYKLSRSPVCRLVSQQRQSCQTIWQWLKRHHHWLEKTVNDVIWNFIFKCLPLMIIKHTWFGNKLNSHYESVDLCTGEVTTVQDCSCLWWASVIRACHRTEHEYTPVALQWHRNRECREQLTLVVCNQWRHMSVLAEGLQIQSCYVIGEELKIWCLTLNADERWDEKNIGKASHCIARPKTL